MGQQKRSRSAKKRKCPVGKRAGQRKPMHNGKKSHKGVPRNS